MDDLIKEDDRLLASIAEGNELAFEHLFYAYKSKVYTIALLFTKNTSDAEEVVQDVFSRIWKYRRRLPDVKNFSAWIITVTRHRSLTVLKKIAQEHTKREALVRSANDCSFLDAESGIRQKEVQTLLQSALMHLTPQQRKIFELTRLQGLDRKTVAASLGLSPATVSVHLTVALRSVRSYLYEHNYELLVVFLLTALC